MRPTSATLVCLVAAGCGLGSGQWTLQALPTEGAPGGSVQSATRLPSGAVLAAAEGGQGARLPAGASTWQATAVPLRSVSVPQANGSVWALATNGSLYPVVNDDLGEPMAFPSAASIFLGQLGDGSLWMIGESNLLFRAPPGAATWEARGTALFGEGGYGTMRDPTHMVKWHRQQGLLQLDLDTREQSVLLPCTHPALRACAMSLDFVAGRHGELYFANSNDSTSSEVELWRLDPGASEPTHLAGPALPGLEKRTPDDAYNRYRPGPALLYVDSLDRVWLAFRWGANEVEDVSYLYGWVGRGDWQLVSSTLPSNTGLGGDGETPLILNLRAGVGFQLSRIVQ